MEPLAGFIVSGAALIGGRPAGGSQCVRRPGSAWWRPWPWRTS